MTEQSNGVSEAWAKNRLFQPSPLWGRHAHISSRPGHRPHTGRI